MPGDTTHVPGPDAQANDVKHESRGAPAVLKYLKTKAEFEQSLAHHPVVIVQFTATWCGACKQIAPKFDELAHAHPTVTFRKVDVDENKETAEAEGIKSMPTFVVYKRSKKRAELKGANPQKLEELVNRCSGRHSSAAAATVAVTPSSVLKFLNTRTEFEGSIAHHPTVIVDFTASWCGPCKAIAPKFEELAHSHPSLTFRKVDVDVNKETAQALGISSMPTFVVFREGKKAEELTGASVGRLERLVRKYAAPARPRTPS